MITVQQQTESRRPLALRQLGCWNWLLKRLAASRVTPNHISVLGVVFGIGAGVALALTSGYETGAVSQRLLLLGAILLVVLRGACNIFDGVLAVETGRASRVGLLYNEVPDRISDIAIFIGAGFAVGGHPMLGMAAALGSLMTAYTRVQVHLAGAPADFSGPMAKPARMVILCLAAAFLAFLPTGVWPTGSGGFGIIGASLTLITCGTVFTTIVRLRNAAAEIQTIGPDECE
ncbi:phosphatidylglycerophosphate synthase [Haloferula helveola]|uniref:Phosphatidylglycerophosphate synthase n=1 Tax=Haloferula helveola TaxID=490095 RepID=A0ABM7RH91_9BACT|nr:phosphatidylglycerophosphate synthase [Haloferula helveola]